MESLLSYVWRKLCRTPLISTEGIVLCWLEIIWIYLYRSEFILMLMIWSRGLFGFFPFIGIFITRKNSYYLTILLCILYLFLSMSHLTNSSNGIDTSESELTIRKRIWIAVTCRVESPMFVKGSCSILNGRDWYWRPVKLVENDKSFTIVSLAKKWEIDVWLYLAKIKRKFGVFFGFRYSASEAKGRGFESRLVHQI